MPLLTTANEAIGGCDGDAFDNFAALQAAQRIRIADESPVERQRLRCRDRFDRVAIAEIDDANHGRRSASQ